MFIGLISDTHGLVRPEALEALRGATHIVHAGDVGSRDVLVTLRQIAPVCAVAGNMDRNLSQLLCQTEVLDLSTDARGLLIFVLHDLYQLDLDPVAAGFSAVVSGHTHRPNIARLDGVLYVNPGSAGPRRSELPISVARLHIEGDGLRPELVELG